MKTMKNDFNGNENNRFGNRRFAHGNNGNCKEEKGMRNTRNDFNRHDNNRPGRFENGFGRFENGCGAHKHGCRTGNGFGRPHFRGFYRDPKAVWHAGFGPGFHAHKHVCRHAGFDFVNGRHCAPARAPFRMRHAYRGHGFGGYRGGVHGFNGFRGGFHGFGPGRRFHGYGFGRPFHGFGRPHFNGGRMRLFRGRPFNRNFRACKPAGFEC